MNMKRIFAFVSALALIISLFVGCSAPEKYATIGYSEMCDTSSYREKKLDPVEIGYTSFSLDKYYNVYTVADGLIRKFSLSNVLKDSFEGTEGLVAPCWYDDYIYAYHPDGRLVKISEDTKAITDVTSSLPAGFALDVAIANDNAFVFLNIFSETQHMSFGELWQVSLTDGTASKIELKDAKAVYASEGGYVYATTYNDGELTNNLYVIEDGDAVLLCELEIASEIMSFVLENGNLYYPDADDTLCIKSLNLATLEKDIIVANVNVFQRGAMRFKNGNLIYIDSATSTLSSAYVLQEETKPETALIINDPYKYEWTENGVFNYSTLSSLSGIKCKAKNNIDDNVLLKIMAGDTDVDIYLLNYETVRKLVDKGIYLPIDSDIINTFNEGCFDYVYNCSYTDEGEMILMPVSADYPAIIYPQAAVDELGFTEDDLLYYDSFIEVVENNFGGKRKAFTTGSMLFYELEFQYNTYYCDFDAKRADYMTDEYKKLYSTLDGWQRYGDPTGNIPIVPPYFVNKVMNLELLKDRSNVLLFNSYFSSAYDDVIDRTNGQNDVSGWRAAPIPRITDKVTSNRAMVYFAYVNPYSTRKDEALKVLETIAENYYKCIASSRYPLIRKDISEYPERYHPDSELFKDFYDIAQNGAVFRIGSGGFHNDIEEYQNGRATLEEAIAMYQREVEIWLNE